LCHVPFERPEDQENENGGIGKPPFSMAEYTSNQND